MDWKHKLDVSDLWKKVSNDEIALAEFTKEVAVKLQSLKNDIPILNHNEIDRLSASLKRVGRTKNKDKFDKVWNTIYDWADANKVWIATF